jgi:hypothetical protein
MERVTLDAAEAQDNRPQYSRTRQLAKPTARSRITNGKELLPGVDGRTLWARRFRDVLALHLGDLGGEANTSEAEKALARRAACLIVELEQLELRFAQSGGAEGNLLERYQRAANSLRRLLESLGLERRAKPVLSLGEVLRADLRRQRDGEANP